MTQDEPRQATLWRRHGRWAVGIGVLLSFLAWLTWSVHPDFSLLVYVGALAGIHRWVVTSRRFTPRVRENLVFLVLGVGLLGMLWMLTGLNNQAMAGIILVMAIYALFGLGLNLQFGYTGIINFGHVAFLGIGAYAVAVMTFRYPHWAGVLQDPGGWSLLAVVLSALLLFLLVGFFFSLVVEWVFTMIDIPFEWRRRSQIIAGTGGGLLAVLVLLWVVPYPLSPMWAMTFFLAAAAVVGMIVAAFAGLLLGLPTLRLRADYLAIVTIGAAEILRRAWLNEAWLTNGALGLSVSRGQRPFDVAFREWQWPGHLAGWLDVGSVSTLLLLLMVVIVVMVVFAGYEVLSRSPYGRVLRAVREDEDLATALGKNVFAYKLQVLAIGGAVAALAGAFLLWQQQFIEPNDFHPLITFYAWIIVVVGGAGNNKGTLLGAVVLWTFFEATRFLNMDANLGLSGTQAGALRVALIGLMLILLMLFKPEGLLGKREELVLGD